MLIEGGGKNSCFRFEDLFLFYLYAEYPQLYPGLGRVGYTRRWRRHNGSVNYLFLDGHVARFRPDEAGRIAKEWDLHF